MKGKLNQQIQKETKEKQKKNKTEKKFMFFTRIFVIKSNEPFSSDSLASAVCYTFAWHNDGNRIIIVVVAPPIL